MQIPWLFIKVRGKVGTDQRAVQPRKIFDLLELRNYLYYFRYSTNIETISIHVLKLNTWGKNRIEAHPGNLYCKRDFSNRDRSFTLNLIPTCLGKFQLELKSFNPQVRWLFPPSVEGLGLVNRKTMQDGIFWREQFILGVYLYPINFTLYDIQCTLPI